MTIASRPGPEGLAFADDVALDADAASLEAANQGPATRELRAQWAAYQVTGVGDGGKVSRVPNRRAARTNAYPAMGQTGAGAKKPVLKLGATPNGKAAIKFTPTPSVRQFLETPRGTLCSVDQTWTVFAVARSSGNSGYGSAQNIFAGAGNSDPYPRILQLRYDLGGADAAAVSGFTGPNGGEKLFQDFTTRSFSATGWHVVTGRRTSGGLECFVDGASDGSKPEPAGTAGSNTSGRRPLRMGIDDDTATSEPFAGLVAEILFYNTNLTEGERQQTESYLRRVYGL